MGEVMASECRVPAALHHGGVGLWADRIPGPLRAPCGLDGGSWRIASGRAVVRTAPTSAPPATCRVPGRATESRRSSSRWFSGSVRPQPSGAGDADDLDGPWAQKPPFLGLLPTVTCRIGMAAPLAGNVEQVWDYVAD